MEHKSYNRDDKMTITYSRRAARYLSQYSWYNPSISKDFKEGAPSLDDAWSHYEHVTLPRRRRCHRRNTSTTSSSSRNKRSIGNDDTCSGDDDNGQQHKNKTGNNIDDVLHSNVFQSSSSRRLLYEDKNDDDRNNSGIDEDPELYPVWKTTLPELADFGVSIRMFFSTLLVFSGILGVAGILNIPLMMYFWNYADGTTNKDGVEYMGIGKMIRASALCDATEWVECDDCHDVDHVQEYPSYRLTVAADTGLYLVRRNICNFDEFLLPGLCSFAATIIILILTAIAFYGKQRQAEIVFDEQIQTASDYSIQIANPPPDALNPEEWRYFFNQYVVDAGVEDDEENEDDDDNQNQYMRAVEYPGKSDKKNEKTTKPTTQSRRQSSGEVVLVTIAINNAELLRTLIRRRQKLQALAKLLPIGTDMSDKKLVENYVMDAAVAISSPSSYAHRSYTFLSTLCKLQNDPQKLWFDICSLEDQVRVLVQRKYDAVAVFVTFDTERSQRNALHALSTGKINVWRNELNRHRSNLRRGGQLKVIESTSGTSLWDFREAAQVERTIQLTMSAATTESCSRARLFRGERVLRIKEAMEPSNVRWLDLEASHRQRLELHIASAMGMIVFVMWSGYFIYRLTANYPGQYAALFITMTNTVVPIVCEFITDLESHPTEHGKQISLYVKMTLFRWFNSAIALSITSSFIETISVEDGNESSEQSLMYKVYPVIVAELFCNPLIELMDLPENFRKHFLAPRTRDQAEMNACFSGGRFWLAERYTNANRVIFVALFFSAILPESLLLGSMALLAQYHVGKFALLRLCGPTPDIGFHLSRLGRNYFIPIVLVTHVVMNAYWWSGYPYDNVCANDEDGNDDGESGGYSYCNQNFYGSRIFPPLPRFQPEGGKWMTEDQERLTSLYGWTSVIVSMVTLFVFLQNNAVPWIRSFYQSTYEPDGMDQGIDFTNVMHDGQIHGYIPQAKVRGFPFPVIACNTDNIDNSLIGWNADQGGYKPHSLVDDIESITGESKRLHPVTSIVRQWDATL